MNGARVTFWPQSYHIEYFDTQGHASHGNNAIACYATLAEFNTLIVAEFNT